MLAAQQGRLQEFFGQSVQPALRLERAQRGKLLLRGVHGLGDVCGVAVRLAVGVVAPVLFDLGLHDSHGADRRAHQGQQLLDGLALLEVKNAASLALRLLRRQAHLQQQRARLGAYAPVRGGEFQMIALGRVCDGAARQKGPAQEGAAAAVIFQQGKIHMQCKARFGGKAAERENMRDFFRVLQHEHALALRLRLRQRVKAQAESALQQARQPRGEFRILRDDADARGTEMIGVQECA